MYSDATTSVLDRSEIVSHVPNVTAISAGIVHLVITHLDWEVCHPRCLCETWKIVCSQTQLCHMRCI